MINTGTKQRTVNTYTGIFSEYRIYPGKGEEGNLSTVFGHLLGVKKSSYGLI